MITIIDYEAGNLKSICNMLDFLGGDKCSIGPDNSEQSLAENCKYKISSNPADIENAERIIFPGQGHFAQSMQNLKNKGLIEPIRNAVANDTKFLGICVGLQVLFEKSEEAPGVEGLGIIKGQVKKFTRGKIPQIGWNRIETTQNNSYLEDDFFYFVNSYYVAPEDKSIISSTANYNIDFAASIERKNLIGVQFHPEKSSQAGIKFFKKWLNLNQVALIY